MTSKSATYRTGPALDGRDAGGLRLGDVEQRADAQVVGPDARQAGAAVDIEDDLIDIGIGDGDGALQFGAEQLLLLFEERSGCRSSSGCQRPAVW